MLLDAPGVLSVELLCAARDGLPEPRTNDDPVTYDEHTAVQHLLHEQLAALRAEAHLPAPTTNEQRGADTR